MRKTQPSAVANSPVMSRGKHANKCAQDAHVGNRMLRYVRIPPPRMCRLQTFAFLTGDLGAGGPGFKSRRPDLKARLLPRLLRWVTGI